MSLSPSQAETCVACLTPSGTAAIATLAICGPRAWDAMRELFRPHWGSRPALPEEPAVGPIWLGRMGADLADEVVLTVTATHPVPCVEVHCHGGREVVRLLQDALADRGIRVCSWQQLESLKDPDPLRVAACNALSNALTIRTAAILLDQYQGALGKAFDAIRLAWRRSDSEEAGRLLANLRRQVNVGRHLVAPWRVVVAGAPNVGKSSLVNALAGYQRCVVAATPGTTRDVVTTIIAVEGWPIELADTAGLGEPGEDLEEQGMDRARMALAAADLCLWIVDASSPPVWPNVALDRLRRIINKVDLPPGWDLDQAPDAIRVSARTGMGLEDLCSALAQWLVLEPPEPGSAVPFTARLCDGVEEAWKQGCGGQWEDAQHALDLARKEPSG